MRELTFKFDVDDYVTVSLHDLRYPGRVQALIWRGRRLAYDIEYCKDGGLVRGEFAEDEIKAKA